MNEIFKEIADNQLLIRLDLVVYHLISIFRTSYLFTDRCYLYLTKDSEREIQVYFKAKIGSPSLEAIAGEFCNELINQQVRYDLAQETGKIRELIVAQAFAEGNLLDEIRESGDFNSDPLKIAKPQC